MVGGKHSTVPIDETNFGHARLHPAMNRDFKALATVNKRSVQAECEIALEAHLQRNAALVKRGKLQPKGKTK